MTEGAAGSRKMTSVIADTHRRLLASISLLNAEAIDLRTGDETKEIYLEDKYGHVSAITSSAVVLTIGTSG
jgi:hypothetical protein